MDFEFSTARNGAKTCTLNSRQYHSAYNPQNESESFVQNTVKPDFIPSAIVIIEPGLSYCLPFLRKKFPEAELYCIRLSHDFSEYDSLWDKVFYFDDNSLSEQLYFSLGEEILLSAAFYPWPQATTLLSEATDNVWKEIKESVLKSRSVLLTRAYFAKKWFKNSLHFFNGKRSFNSLKKINADIVICASGPSLKASIPFIKQNRKKFFLMAVSSALSPLLDADILPDLVVSTDGGWWAKAHLCMADSTFALADESAVPKEILNNAHILPLNYENSLGSKLYEKLKIKTFKAYRNGTVSGTAALMALDLTDKNVYFCGLDLAPAPGFQHTGPNKLENRSSNYDFRSKTKETRVTSSRFNSAGSLKIYRDWFVTQNVIESNRFFRLSDNFNYEFSLGHIQDLNWEQVTFSKNDGTESEIQEFVTTQKNLWNALLEISESELFKSELFPLETILLKRSSNKEEKNTILEKIALEKEKILQNAGRFLNVQ